MRFKKKTLTSLRLQKRQRKAFVGRIVFAIICVVGFWGLVFLASSAKAITIRDIEIVGVTSISSSNIKDEAQKFLTGRYFFTVPKANIFFYPKSDIGKSLAELFPRLDSVVVRFKNFHAIDIKVSERKAEALWCQDESEALADSERETCYILDKNGFAFASFLEIANAPNDFIIFYSSTPKENPIKQTYTTTEYFRALLGFAKDLNTLGFTVSLFRERQNGDFEAKLSSGGQRLIFGRDADFASILNNFQTIVSNSGFGGSSDLSKIEYVDFRFGNKVFYKPSGQW
ncbi:MAG: hypothetical protein UV05_C0009G0014 [candidate division CPR1 bacterium GW2011_GWA2_42_17]|uniref:POTRA domain-containing protein n=1 Tax=candidate division CPR1 bacterium GW2011_GWA2_42_17 TaxID=1618341 RepID=A0A0G0Z6C5_9BACT|nr:MAG: hypothetical protein UV05_C0009G0014 [candidate division CPR1 bacterium GW2011_GWA2_42_17]